MACSFASNTTRARVNGPPGAPNCPPGYVVTTWPCTSIVTPAGVLYAHSGSGEHCCQSSTRKHGSSDSRSSADASTLPTSVRLAPSTHVRRTSNATHSGAWGNKCAPSTGEWKTRENSLACTLAGVRPSNAVDGSGTACWAAVAVNADHTTNAAVSATKTLMLDITSAPRLQ